MIALLDTSEDLLVCRQELGCPVEQLLTPLTMFKRQNQRAKFAIDNGAFAGFKAGPFKGLLLREKGYAPENWLEIVWLCVYCHRKADEKL